VVERSLGKGEVVSSILTGSTTFHSQFERLRGEHSPFPRVSSANEMRIPPVSWGNLRGLCSAIVLVGLDAIWTVSHVAAANQRTTSRNRVP
jgi:hypothetical protein